MVARHDFYVEGPGYEFRYSYKDGPKHEALVAMVTLLEAHTSSLKEQTSRPSIQSEQTEAYVTGLNGFSNGGYNHKTRQYISKERKTNIKACVWNSNKTYKEIAREFGVSISTVARIAASV